MKAVYRSIKPFWLYLIIIGKKKIEVGKTMPKADDWNKEVFLHCSKDMKSFKRIPEKDREWMRKYLGKVACRFVCDRIRRENEVAYGLVDVGLEITSCVPAKELVEYANWNALFSWHISNLVIYDKPRELSEFKRVCDGNCQSCKYAIWQTSGWAYEPYIVDCKPMTRPPQSWCYVEAK